MDTIIPQKRCRLCGEAKPLSDFYKLARNADGHDTRCKECEKAYARELTTKIQKRREEQEETLFDIPQVKKCIKCNEMKPLHKLRTNKATRCGRANICYSCYRRLHPTPRLTQKQSRKKHLRNVGITHEQYDAMLESQNGVCAACGHNETIIHNHTKKIRHLAIDHNHKTGKIRGLLCSACNTSLGLLCEDPERIEGLLRYLREH